MVNKAKNIAVAAEEDKDGEHEDYVDEDMGEGSYVVAQERNEIQIQDLARIYIDPC